MKFIYHDQTYLYYLKLADELGSASAQLVFGNEYYTGKLLERDLQKSLSYFEKSFNNENVSDNDKYYAMSASGDIMIGGGCGEAAVEVVKNMPRWEPGRQAGKAIRTQFSLPLKFELKSYDSTNGMSQEEKCKFLLNQRGFIK